MSLFCKSHAASFIWLAGFIDVIDGVVESSVFFPASKVILKSRGQVAAGLSVTRSFGVRIPERNGWGWFLRPAPGRALRMWISRFRQRW